VFDCCFPDSSQLRVGTDKNSGRRKKDRNAWVNLCGQLKRGNRQQPHGTTHGWEDLYSSHMVLPSHCETRGPPAREQDPGDRRPGARPGVSRPRQAVPCKAAVAATPSSPAFLSSTNTKATTCTYSIAPMRWVLRLLEPFSARQLLCSVNFSHVIFPTNSMT